MAGNFNFTTKLGLDANGFNRGVRRVQSSLNSLKSTFLSLAGALGAGLGFTQLISSIRNTATELSTAMNTLKNVSYQTKAFKDGMEEVSVEVSNFTDNLNFVKRVSKEYHQDLVAITDNYAKFTAACKKTNLGLEDQRLVFESLTRAAAFFHLSADRTSDMMNAVVQMMSKGKVTAEELRRQLGNTLPGAFNLMAAAVDEANGSTAKLEELMRKGLVSSEKALPRFAAMLNSVTKNIEFDSIQSSLNDLKNAWYDFVQESGAEDFYKNIIDGTAGALNSVTNNMNGIKSVMVGLITFLSTRSIFTALEQQGNVMKNSILRDLKVIEAQMYSFKRKLAGPEFTASSTGVYSAVNPSALSEYAGKAMLNYNNHLKQAIELQLKLGIITKAQYDTIVLEINQANAALTGLNTRTNTAAASTGRLALAWNGLNTVITKAATGIANFFKANWVFMLISALSIAISYISKIRQEAERIANITTEYANDITKVEKSTAEEAAKLKNNLAIVKDTTEKESVRLENLKQINKQLGLVGDKALTLNSLNNTVEGTLDGVKGKYDEITLAVGRWIEATKKQALIQAYAGQIAEASAKKGLLEEQRKDKEDALARAQAQKGNSGSFIVDLYDNLGGERWMPSVDAAERELRNLNNEIAQYDKVITKAEAAMKELGVSLGDFYDILNGGTGETETDLTKVYGNYLKEEKKLANQLKEGALTKEKYNEAFDKMVQDFWKSAAATGELSIEDITKKFDKGTTLSAMEEWYRTLAINAAEAAKNALLKDIQEDLLKTLDEEIEAAAKEADDQIDAYLDKEAKKFEKQLNLDAGVIGGDYVPDKRKDRNSLFDYNKKGSQITNEELDQTNQWLDDIKKKYGDLIQESNELGYRTEIVQKELDELSELYRYAAKEAQTLEAAMNYQKVVEDIKDVKKELNNLVYSGVKDFATSLDRVVSAWKTLDETMNDSKSTGWDKFMAVFNMMTQIIDTAIGVYQTITTIQELQTKLGATKLAEQAALNELLKQELAYRMAINGASDAEIQKRIASMGTLFAEEGILAGILGLKKKENQTTAVGIGLKSAEAGVTAAAASASAGEAVANATASGAKMPFPLNLAAIALGIGAVVAALATMSKFANGGIVGGNAKHGDRNIARVNSGEMILNKAQQGTLWGLLNGKGSIGGNVEFKIKGSDLVGTINNYSKKISK